MQFSRSSALAAFLFAANAVTVSARCAPKMDTASSSSTLIIETTPATSTLTPPAMAVAVATPTPSSSSSTLVLSTATPSATAAADDTNSNSNLSTDEQDALAAHNTARADVGEAALAWDASLASAAQSWADTLGARGPGSLEHGSTGENLYWQSGGDDPFTAAAQAWIAEKSAYNGEAIPSSGDASWMHYSQVIWASTTKLGMAIASDGQGGTYVVARYDPAGNYIGEVPTEA